MGDGQRLQFWGCSWYAEQSVIMYRCRSTKEVGGKVYGCQREDRHKKLHTWSCRLGDVFVEVTWLR